MKLTLERDGLAEAVAWAARTLPARPTNPVLAGVLLSASEESLTLSSSDHAVSSQVAIPAEEVGEPGRSVVSGRLLADIAKALPPRPVTLNLEGTRLVVTCGRSVFTLPTLPVAEYPVLPDLPPTLGSCSGSTLAEAVAQVVIATSREDTVPMLTGIRLEFDADAITLSATDRYRMAMRRLEWQSTGRDTAAHVLVRGKTLSDLVRPLAGVDVVQLALDDSRSLIGISGAARRSTTAVLDADFPDVKRLLPKESSSVVELPTAALIDAVKRVKLVLDRVGSGASILLDCGREEMLLRAGAGEDASATETIECSMSGDPIKIAFNPEYLLEGLSALTGTIARLAMTESRKPAVISAVDDDIQYQYLLMPIRLPG